MNKLKTKKQSDSQQKRAAEAITAYHGLESADSANWNTFKDRYEEISRGKDRPKFVNTGWRSINKALEPELENAQRVHSP
jgi:hypothetical protein